MNFLLLKNRRTESGEGEGEMFAVDLSQQEESYSFFIEEEIVLSGKKKFSGSCSETEVSEQLYYQILSC